MKYSNYRKNTKNVTYLLKSREKYILKNREKYWRQMLKYSKLLLVMTMYLKRYIEKEIKDALEASGVYFG